MEVDNERRALREQRLGLESETGVARAASWDQREGWIAGDVQEIGREQSEWMLREQRSDGGFVVNVEGGGFVVDVEKRRWPAGFGRR